MLAFADVLGALEHHVFEKMGKAGSPGPLIARADIVGNGNRVSGRRVVFRENDSQAIFKLLIGEFDCLAEGGRQNQKQINAIAK